MECDQSVPNLEVILMPNMATCSTCPSMCQIWKIFRCQKWQLIESVLILEIWHTLGHINNLPAHLASIFTHILGGNILQVASIYFPNLAHTRIHSTSYHIWHLFTFQIWHILRNILQVATIGNYLLSKFGTY